MSEFAIAELRFTGDLTLVGQVAVFLCEHFEQTSVSD